MVAFRLDILRYKTKQVIRFGLFLIERIAAFPVTSFTFQLPFFSESEAESDTIF